MPSQDVVLGLYYATRERINGKGEGMVFSDVGECSARWTTARQVELTAKISVRLVEWTATPTGEFVPETKLCRHHRRAALLSEILPKGLPSATSTRR